MISPNGGITVPVAHMAALNENTVWTWNAIGKRKGAWALDERQRGDHGLSAEPPDHRSCLPDKGDGQRCRTPTR